MATLSVTNPTLMDVAKRLDPKGNIDTITELLSEQNEILLDATAVEANNITSHRTTVRSGLPAVTWRKLNYGVQPSKSRTVQVTDNIGMLEARAEIDQAAFTLNGNSAAWRLSEEVPFIEAMNQEMASTLIYGNEGTEPEAFTGLAPRFNSQSAENGGNILTSAATPDNTDNTSIWLVCWSPTTVHLIYPKGSKAGLQVNDLGVETVTDSATPAGKFRAVVSHYKWDVGLCVRDWRYVVRINYDLENVIASAATGPDLFQLMGQAIRRIPNLNMGRLAFYANRDSLDALDLQANARSTLAYGNFEDATGKLVNKFRGIPVRRCDAILSNEAGI